MLHLGCTRHAAGLSNVIVRNKSASWGISQRYFDRPPDTTVHSIGYTEINFDKIVANHATKASHAGDRQLAHSRRCLGCQLRLVGRSVALTPPRCHAKFVRFPPPG